LETLIRDDLIGPELDQCFELTRLAGASQKGIDALRQQVELENPTTVGAIMIRDSGVDFCLATEGRIIADMTFVSRRDVAIVQNSLVASFLNAE
jgi:hypothetical protein